MRPASELNDHETLGKKILAFAQGYRTLLVPHSVVLADTVLKLAPLVQLSDKVLPLKSYFNMVQDIQRTMYLARALATELTKQMPDGTPDQEAARADRAAQLEEEFRYKGVAYLNQQLAHVDDGNSSMTEDERAGAWRRREDRVSQESQRHLCTEDVFMLACAFLKVDIAKQGSVYYLKGESPDFKETKRNRNPLNLSSDVALKTLASGLARPDGQRGAVERGQIDSGFNHLVKLNQLHNTMLEVVHWIKTGEQDGHNRTKVIVRQEFGLSHTDYERIMSMGRRAGLVGMRNRKKDPSNNYVLKQHLHARVMDHAARTGCTPQKALNAMFDDYFQLLELMARQKELGKKKGGR